MAGPSKRSFASRLRKAFRDHVYDVDHVLYFEKPLDGGDNLRPLAAGDRVAHIATSVDDLGPLIDAFPKRAGYFREYVSRGITAFYATKDGKVLAYVFGTTEDFYDRHLWKNTVTVPPRHFFHFAGFVVPSSRGSSVSLYLLRKMYEHFRKQGISTAITTISSRNVPSWRLCLKLGYVQKPLAWDVYNVPGFTWSRPVPVRTWVTRAKKTGAGTKAEAPTGR
ncbi:GNAT family N-acetyltransferase [Jannaschia rubra]|uniref:N-acetyltransferase domain-containing protein n=1 Tax=Jannaschia rubra TaxID=282197 RepID=A0A0M6XWX1_9RHOB|nr:GNAT family N-acetyltransferase [Jannaschia rubra]CTQ34803.1 hypothetical protein JAN5088_03599 [Jannaschia rubra]SFG80689.1 Acetyltransferase (GNAT) family protein [Jannaschia rubra]